MRHGELKARRRRKALDQLRTSSFPPHLNTTDALWALDAGCGPVKFHRILQRRGLATPAEGFVGGYEFHLPSECGGGTYAIHHRSFQWSPIGLSHIAGILRDEGIGYTIPDELRRWLQDGSARGAALSPPH
jgi:hypothetical protein